MLTSQGVSRSVLTRSLRCGTRLPVALRPGAGLCGEALLGHQSLAGPLRRNVADEKMPAAVCSRTYNISRYGSLFHNVTDLSPII